MEGYGRSSYGDRFADVYDDWYRGLNDVDATVTALLALAGDGPVLELGVGTGRLAIPLAVAGADRGITVHGIDSSTAMLDVMQAKPGAEHVEVHVGDMVDDMPDGPFALAYVAYNTLFNLAEPDRQAGCFRAVAERLAPGGCFVVEAFVPDDPPRDGAVVTVRSMTADRVVLSVSIHHPANNSPRGSSSSSRMRAWSACARGRSATRLPPSSTRWLPPPACSSSTDGRSSATTTSAKVTNAT